MNAGEHRASGCVGVAASVALELGALSLDVDLDVDDGEVVALLGPNGAGKTTILRALAGLLPIDSGIITIDGRVVDDPAHAIFIAPHERPVGLVFQDHLLFTTMSVRENIAFGLRARKVARRQARERAGALLERFELGRCADWRVGELSGGQRQRVALARALAVEPRLLLLDEPLAALDATTKAAVRRELSEQLAAFGGARVVVTHDPVDAYALADRLVIVEDGRVVQQGSPAAIAAHPRSRYVADLVGVNLIKGTIAGGVLTTEQGGHVVIADGALSGAALASVHPHAVSVHTAPPGGSPRNVWPVTVGSIDRHGDRVRVQLDGPVPLVAEITPSAIDSLGLRAGAPAWAAVKATEVVAYPA